MTPYAQTLENLGRLIAFPTISAESNLALIDHAEDLLTKAGCATQRIPDPVLAKSGLVARIGPSGPGACCFRRTVTWCRFKGRRGRDRLSR
ncbi:hypothetical protein ACFQFQ_25130 [Sulfitobacter porphyrae]|uniref:Acetylornithine deacetylase n=1 Tax=Sulfitobacter porphyrae TaxID=1246864 RepID=A0ABW2B9B8_9RHOB